MKKLLFLLLILQVITAIIQFFVLLDVSLLYSVIMTGVCVLQIVLTFAVITNIDDIENLSDMIYKLKYDVKVLTDSQAQKAEEE